jgi:hypothetical protein
VSPKPKLTIDALWQSAREFALSESIHPEPTLYGVTDGKAVGTYLEQKFRQGLLSKYEFQQGNSAKGIDLPELDVDLKVTSIRQPQSSCPFKDARQKIYGLGYSLLIFVYEKTDNPALRTSTLKILHVIYVERSCTGDYQMTHGLREILLRNGNKDDLMAFMFDRNLPVDDISAGLLADEILSTPPQQGYLTISNALQWRLQYRRVIDQAGLQDGLIRVC